MTLYGIAIHGCDDVNEFNMDLTDEERAVITRLSQRSRETSRYDCQPRLTVGPPLNEDEDDE